MIRKDPVRLGAECAVAKRGLCKTGREIGYMWIMKDANNRRLAGFFLIFLLLSVSLYASEAGGEELRLNRVLPDSMYEVLGNAAKGDYVDNLISAIEYLQRNREGYDYGELLTESLLPAVNAGASLYQKAYSYYLAGIYFMMTDDWEQSLLYYAQALGCCTSGKDGSERAELEKVEIKVYFAMGSYWYSLGDLQKALEANETARNLNNAVGDSMFDAYVLNNTALIYKTLGENAAALPLFRQNLERMHILPPDVYPLTLANMASCYIGLGQVDSAVALLDSALKISNVSEGNYELSNTYYLLGKAYNLEGDLVSAMRCLDKGLEASRRFGEMDLRARIWMEKAAVLEKQSDYEGALALIDSAMRTVEDSKNRLIQMEAIGMKSTLNDCAGNMEEAYVSLKQYLELVRQANMEENERQTRRQLLQSEFELARQRIDFEYKNRELELRNQMNRYTYGFTICFLVLSFGIIVVLFYYKKKKVELKNRQLEEQALKDELELKEKELVNEVMLRMAKDEVLKDTIKELVSHGDKMPDKERQALSPLIWKMRRSLNSNMLAEFEASFSQMHQRFFERLQQDYPRLTHSEKRLCAFIKLNLSTKEIAMIMNQDPNSVRIARVRLRRKLGLTQKSESLSEFLSRY